MERLPPRFHHAMVQRYGDAGNDPGTIGATGVAATTAPAGRCGPTVDLLAPRCANSDKMLCVDPGPATT
ncbi:hypothetical protein GCM10009845_10190 [Pedococcus bigeumensis]